MLEMKNFFFYNMFRYLKKVKKINNKKLFLFTLIKNFYLVIKSQKNLKLLNCKDNIKMYYTTLSSVNLLLNKKIDKWFIYKMISNINWI